MHTDQESSNSKNNEFLSFFQDEVSLTKLRGDILTILSQNAADFAKEMAALNFCRTQGELNREFSAFLSRHSLKECPMTGYFALGSSRRLSRDSTRPAFFTVL
ncbi:hypothetical protein PAPYR_5572 [Paratrimastix pyriformis]|uniref:Uncharacterized protein n=1 Tax=Paratrimastix pyriformis TaxID=342808 RepID=A0ABQ8UH94_9EUKA|nr:hypothetical protein PAPYR_5572 [Paratrimastix pyriformis]